MSQKKRNDTSLQSMFAMCLLTKCLNVFIKQHGPTQSHLFTCFFLDLPGLHVPYSVLDFTGNTHYC